MKVMVTGAAGFIGSNLTDRLLSEGHDVVGVDNFNDYYDPKIKEVNLRNAQQKKNFKSYREDILNFQVLKNIFEREKPQKIIHLAARAGVRPSIDNPLLYAQVNIEGTVNLLKLAVDFSVKQFIFGSSSSVYGNSKIIPFKENDLCDQIISPYGASKRSAELFVESFAKNYALKCTILRFFTVYGPRGRPDMAPALFLNAALTGKKIKQFGNGTSARDYTYIADIVNGIAKALKKDFKLEIINLGNNHPVKLSDFIKTIEKVSGIKLNIEIIEKQSGDVDKTWADIDKAKQLIGWEPKTTIETGLHNFLKWLKNT